MQIISIHYHLVGVDPTYCIEPEGRMIILSPIYELIAFNKPNTSTWLPEPAGIEVIGFIIHGGQPGKGFMIPIRCQ